MALVNYGKGQTYAYLCSSFILPSDASQNITRPDTPHCSSTVLSCSLSLPFSLKGGGKLISDKKSQYFQGIWAPVTYRMLTFPFPHPPLTSHWSSSVLFYFFQQHCMHITAVCSVRVCFHIFFLSNRDGCLLHYPKGQYCLSIDLILDVEV